MDGRGPLGKPFSSKLTTLLPEIPFHKRLSMAHPPGFVPDWMAVKTDRLKQSGGGLINRSNKILTPNDISVQHVCDGLARFFEGMGQFPLHSVSWS